MSYWSIFPLDINAVSVYAFKLRDKERAGYA